MRQRRHTKTRAVAGRSGIDERTCERLLVGGVAHDEAVARAARMVHLVETAARAGEAPA